MPYLIDTSVLGRLANASDAQHAAAAGAVLELHRRGELLHVTPQIMIEFRNVATRPAAVNGLGLSTVDAEALAATFEARFPLLEETPDIYPAWKSLVSGLGIIGKRVHDARLVAVCHVNSVSNVLTFNVAHFSAMAGFGPGIVVVDPQNV
ncbi:MAG: type II toxin-antitoxin system VapC family toxin [Planctomycetes bacterium]|nr:type II toxin-antitoxin system VapC family toxin [Planctomycetota bacterium]